MCIRDSVKTALNLRVADYLLKPVNKVEMGNILEKIQHQIQQPSQELANRLIHDDISEEEFCRYIAGRNSLWTVSYTHLDVYKRQLTEYL